jgi:hypothetical protein
MTRPFFDPPPSPVSTLLAWCWHPFVIAHSLDSLPAMSRAYLESLGFSDERLEARRRELFGEEPGRLRLASSEPDTQALQCRRREVFDAIITIDYSPTTPTPAALRAAKHESVIISRSQLWK